MKHLYYIRHGESVMNVQHLCSGTTDTPLTDLGIQQATNAGDSIKKLKLVFDAIISSPLRRAKDTAYTIAETINFPTTSIEITEDLIERNFGYLEGKNFTKEIGITIEFYYAHPRCIDHVDGVETLAELHTRAEKLVAYLQSRPEDTILLVGHSAFLRSLQRVLHEHPFDHPLDYTQNATLIKLL